MKFRRKFRLWLLRNRTAIRLILLLVIIAVGIFAWSLREPPVNDLYRLVKIVDGPTMPTSLAQIQGNERLYISHRHGVISVIEDDVLLETPFLDIESKVQFAHVEQGLFRIIFDPNVHENGYFYVHYTAQPDGRTIIERYTLEPDNPTQADLNSAELVYSVEQMNPQHNGGDMQFGSDGYLYIGLGDSGERQAAANIDNTYGSIIRLDVNNLPYEIPNDNPFIAVEDAAPEVWVYGLRNPWRFSFDRLTDDMYIGDVGAEEFEEVNFISQSSTAGMNFGWPTYEASTLLLPETEPDAVPPIYEYEHFREGIDARVFQCSITGGYVYRGEALPDLQGYYLFGDWCSGSIWTLKQNSPGTWEQEDFMETAFKINAFGEDNDGELYVLTVSDGIWKLVER